MVTTKLLQQYHNLQISDVTTQYDITIFINYTATKKYSMGVQPFYGKGPHPLLLAGWQTATSGIPNYSNYCVIFIVHR
jgi:hypothetical protein